MGSWPKYLQENSENEPRRNSDHDSRQCTKQDHGHFTVTLTLPPTTSFFDFIMKKNRCTNFSSLVFPCPF
ncbi:hypothetical protein L1987_54625 [Smallanthus sonchifolius]|uniref:Uncharacterized protein n=1 Tax=Smallanthus sonchifolius TaxID=185202 RepID=A0ACB9E7L6_9ASTR|nr:hypothetical protein L1987_54625 [Smallanthus sonchifolius]